MDRKKFLHGTSFFCIGTILGGLLDSCVNDHLVEPSNTPSVPLPSQNITTSSSIAGVTQTTTAPLAIITGTGTVPSGNILLTLDLSNSAYARLNSSGGYVIQSNIIVFNTGSGFMALSSVCTHKGCAVYYTNGIIFCPCHAGKFNTNGTVISGPPPRPLQKYTTSLNGSILYIS